MKVEFLQEAEEEFRDAARYYENVTEGLGVSFAAAVEAATTRIADAPYSGPVVKRSLRKNGVRAFPYNVVYSIEEGAIVIVAVAHQKRRPGYWRNRTTASND